MIYVWFPNVSQFHMMWCNPYTDIDLHTVYYHLNYKYVQLSRLNVCYRLWMEPRLNFGFPEPYKVYEEAYAKRDIFHHL